MDQLMPFYQTCYAKAQEVVKELSAHGVTDGARVLSFLQQYSCFGIPSIDKPTTFDMGKWIIREGLPAKQQDAVSWILQTHGETPVIPRGRTGLGWACFLRGPQAIILFDVDLLSPLELAANWLHEGYNAINTLGQKLGIQHPVYNQEIEESNAWTLTLNVLDVGGKDHWRAAVEQEIRAISVPLQHFKPSTTQQMLIARSGTYWPETDKVFGASTSPAVQNMRKELVSIRANIAYWSKRLKLPQQQISHSIVKHFYS